MPTYNFINKTTGEVIERFMSMAEKEKFLCENPDFESHFCDVTAAIGDSVRLGLRKPDDSFRDRLKFIKSKHRRSIINTF